MWIHIAYFDGHYFPPFLIHSRSFLDVSSLIIEVLVIPNEYKVIVMKEAVGLMRCGVL
jgi:hypothetical protein